MAGSGVHERVAQELAAMRAAGTRKRLRHLTTATGPVVEVEGDGEVVLLCSNNYLGLAAHPEVVAAAQAALERYGAGPASVRFICGTTDLHRRLEERLADWVGTEAALTYAACWNANEGVIPALAGEGDVLLSDELNHASIIDACRLARGATRTVFRHSDMGDLEAKLTAAAGARSRIVVTDGVFSMEGDLARLPALVDLAQRYDALLIVDDSHGLGVLGATGRGVAEHFGLLGRVDVITGTLGKALGGAAGGFVAGSRSIIEYLVQKSRPQLFSTALPPAVLGAALGALDVLAREPQRVRRLHENAEYVRAGLQRLGYRPLESESAIVPILIGDTAAAMGLSERLYAHGVYVVGFGYPVVPEGSARLRVQVSAAHTQAHLDRALAAFAAVRPG